MASKQRRPSAPGNTRQNGGTFLGVVLGLIVGLAIAVVVALYITRSPTPFVSRSPTAAGSDAASGNVDPNRPLAGAKPGIAVPQSAQPAPPNTAPGQPANPSTGLLDEPKIVEVPAPAPSTTAAAPAAPADSNNDSDSDSATPHWPSAPAKTTPKPGAAKPNAPTSGALTSHAQASSSASAASSAHPKPSGAASSSSTSSGANPPGDANTGYLLQVGAYRTEADADQQRARLALMGYDAHVTRRDSGAVTFFRVRVGPFAKFDDMNGVRQRLSSAGVDTAVIRFTKQ